MVRNWEGEFAFRCWGGMIAGVPTEGNGPNADGRSVVGGGPVTRYSPATGKHEILLAGQHGEPEVIQAFLRGSIVPWGLGRSGGRAHGVNCTWVWVSGGGSGYSNGRW